jgi:uncharacterized protein (DUF2236 family)
MARRVYGEGVLLLGGGRALLLQLAHPQVAQGVAEHSYFSAGPGARGARLLRTLRPTLAMVFGTGQQAHTAAAAVNHIHASVHGRGYDALDPQLLLWVLATLIDTTLLMQRRFLRPLSPLDAEAYYQDMRRIGAQLGLPEEAMPPHLAGLEAYFQDTLAGLSVSPQVRQLADELFRPRRAQEPLMWLLRSLTAELLPAGLRCEFGLTSTRRDRLAISTLIGASRRLLPVLPARLRRPPAFLLPGHVQGSSRLERLVLKL